MSIEMDPVPQQIGRIEMMNFEVFLPQVVNVVSAGAVPREATGVCSTVSARNRGPLARVMKANASDPQAMRLLNLLMSFFS